MRRKPSYPSIPSAPLQKIELIDYSKGLNTFQANDILPENMWRLSNNARISSYGRYSTRLGTDFYSVPAGETANVSQVSVTGAGDSAFGLNTWLAQKFTASASGRLTKIDLNLKNTALGTGPIIIEIRADNAGSPSSTALASSSITGSLVLSSYSYLSARFIEAPVITNASSYWIIAYLQDDALYSYNWSSTTNASLAKSSTTQGTDWTALGYDLNYKTYISTNSPALGHFRAYKSDGTKKTLLAHGTNLYTINDSTGALTSIKAGLTAAGLYRFTMANGVTYYCNGQDGPRKWDFTTESANAGTTTVATNLILHKDQVFYLDKTNNTKIFFTDKTAYETFTATNFLYVPTPLSADPITAMEILNDNLVIWTRKTKWVLFGSDLTNFVLRKSTGLKGTYSQDQVKATRNHAYFISDVGVFRFNGASDELISEPITDEFNAIADKTTITTAISNNRFYMFYTPSGGGFNSKCLVYNINYGSWESIDLDTYIARCILWDGGTDSNEFIQASNLVGALYYAEKTSNTYNNLGKQLDFELSTKYEFFGSPASKKRVKRWYPRFAAQSNKFNIICAYDKDFNGTPTNILVDTVSAGSTWGSGYTWGSGKLWGASTLVSPRLSVSGRAKYIQFRIKRKGVNTPVEFYGHSLLYFVQRPR